MKFVVPLFMALLAVISRADSPRDPNELFAEYHTSNPQRVIFKKPIVVPYSYLTPKIKRQILHAKNDLDRLAILVYINGELTRAQGLFEDLDDKYGRDDYIKASPKPSPEWEKTNVVYCRAKVILYPSGVDAFFTYIGDTLYPYIDSESTLRGINFGDAVTTKFKFAVDIPESERPNPQTIRGLSKQLIDVTCLRHSGERKRVRIKDFISAFGEKLVDVQ